MNKLYSPNHPTFHSEEMLVNWVRGRECFVSLSILHCPKENRLSAIYVTWSVVGKTWYYAEYFMWYHFFLYISCYIAEIWITFLTVYSVCIDLIVLVSCTREAVLNQRQASTHTILVLQLSLLKVNFVTHFSG